MLSILAGFPRVFGRLQELPDLLNLFRRLRQQACRVEVRHVLVAQNYKVMLFGNHSAYGSLIPDKIVCVQSYKTKESYYGYPDISVFGVEPEDERA